jgi:hypothetical protein
MLICMRTTLNLDDELMRAVKRRAAEIGSTMTEIFEQALREHLRGNTERDQPFVFHWVTVKGRALPGVDITDRDALYEQMEDRSGVERQVSDETPARREGARRRSAKEKRR